MIRQNPPTGTLKALRLRAEQRVLTEEERRTSRPDSVPSPTARRLVHELRVYQAELEMQNEELRCAQVQLNIARSRYFDLYDLAPVGYLSLNDSGVIEEANQTMAGMLGLTRGRMVHQPLSAFILAADQDAYFLHTNALKTSGTPQVAEVRLKRHEATPLWVQLDSARLGTVDEPAHWRTTVTNITARKQVEIELRDEHALLEAAERLAQVGSWRVDLKTGKLHGSTELRRLFGSLPEYFDPLDTIDFEPVHPEDRMLVKAWHWACMDGNACPPLEVRIRCGTSGYRTVRGMIELQRDVTGQAVGLMGSIQDITARKVEEEHLKQAAALFECAGEGVIVTDAKARLLRVNQAFCDFVGYTREELIGQTPRLLKSGRHDDAFYTAMYATLAQKGFWQGEVWNRHKSGEVRQMLLHISAIKDLYGELTHYVAVYTDLSQLKHTTATLDFLAHHDPLTRLPNRLVLFSRLQHALDVSHREDKRLALLMLDLDRFKDVNESFGHLAGDQLLQQVAARLTARLREIDTIARLGGDEFAVLLEDISHIDDAAKVAMEIILAVDEPYRLQNGAEVRIGASIGITSFPENGRTCEELLQQADAAMYRAKAAGRGQFHYFSEELTAAARQRVKLESLLRRALHNDELTVYFQPQINLDAGTVVGAEALVRWHDPDNGLRLPECFIGVAEETGLIEALGERVLSETCRQGRQWLDQGLSAINLAVNVSLHQLRHGDFSATVARVLAETGFPAQHLELELTESALMERETEAGDILQSLRQLGVRLALDDFGTGYSSFGHLKRFPIDVIKIDKGFVDDIPTSQQDMDIVAAIIAMGHTLHLQVLAEGVETQAQLAFLQAHDCDFYQGYYKSPPLPADAFATRFLQHTVVDTRSGRE